MWVFQQVRQRDAFRELGRLQSLGTEPRLKAQEQTLWFKLEAKCSRMGPFLQSPARERSDWSSTAVQSLPAGARFVSAALISPTVHPLQRGEECPWFPPQHADNACLLNLPFKIFQSCSCVFQSLAGRRVGESNTIKSHI